MNAPSNVNPSDAMQGLLFTYASACQGELERALFDSEHAELIDVCRYIVDAGGKRLRPLLTLLACEAVGGDYQKALPASTATELAHTLSIIQDDIFDRATMRRGIEPVHVKWGTPAAILASDYLFLKMIHTLLRLAGSEADSWKLTLDVLNTVVSAGLESVDGEYLDLRLGWEGEATVEQWLRVAEKKTGALIRAALEVGSLIGCGAKEETTALRDYGQNLGVAYQIVDDLLGFKAHEVIGKDTGIDIVNNRLTIVLAHALQSSDSDFRREILVALSHSETPPMQWASRLREMFETTGSLSFAQGLASDFADKAVICLSPLKPTRAKSILMMIPSMVLSRSR